MDGIQEGILAKMPLAEAVLTVWRFVADEDRLQSVFERHRGRCYEQSNGINISISHFLSSSCFNCCRGLRIGG